MLDLEPIKARDAAATPGPWLLAGTHAKPHHTVHASGVTGYQVHSMQRVADEAPDVYKHMKATYFRDAAFIAHARRDVPALVAEVETLRAVIEDCARLLDGDGYVVTAQRLREGLSPRLPRL